MILRRLPGVSVEKLETEWWEVRDKPLGKYLHSAGVTEGGTEHTGKVW